MMSTRFVLFLLTYFTIRDTMIAISGGKVMSSFSDMLGYLRRRENMSQKELADKAGVSRSAIGMYEAGEREPSFETLEAFADIFNVNMDTLLGKSVNEELLPNNVQKLIKMKKIPLVGTIACGTPILAEENITDYIDMPGHIRADYALTCKGDSMINAGIRDGDIVYIRKQSQVENGQIAAVLIGGEEATLKRFYRTDGYISLNAENPQYAPIVFFESDASNVRVIGLAVAYTHVLK